MLLIFEVFSNVTFSVASSADSLSMHLPRLPRPIVFLPVSPLINPFPLNQVVCKLSIIKSSVIPDELSRTVLLPCVVLSSVLRFVHSSLYSLPVLLVPHKLSFVHCAVRVVKLPYSVEFVFPKLSLVNVS